MAVAVVNPAILLSPVEALRGALQDGFATARATLALPVLPEIAGRVISLANDPNTEIDELAALIERDQTLAATVLKFANSAAYAIGEEITSLHQAMMRMGTTTVSGIAIAACLEGEAFRTPAYDAFRRRVLVHALLASGIARDLARRKRCHPEMVFMCALLHTIGQPVVVRLISDLQRASRRRISEYEALPLIGEFERPAAVAATRAWNLPRHVQIAAEYYRCPEEAPAFVLETRITALAGRLAGWIGQSCPPDERSVRKFPDWEALGLGADEVDEVVATGRELRRSTRVIL